MLSFIEGIWSCWCWCIPSNILHPHLCFWRHFLWFTIFIFIKSCCYWKGFWSKSWNRFFRLTWAKFDGYGWGFLCRLTTYGKSKLGDLCRLCWEVCSFIFSWSLLSAATGIFPSITPAAPARCGFSGFSSPAFPSAIFPAAASPAATPRTSRPRPATIELQSQPWTRQPRATIANEERTFQKRKWIWYHQRAAYEGGAG